MKEDYSKYSDQELSIALKKKKPIAEAAFAEIYSRYSHRVYAYCLRVTGDEEEAVDIFQDVFFKFMKSTESKAEGIYNIGGFLIRITRNLCLNYKRDKKNFVAFDVNMFKSNDKSYEDRELLDLIARALDLLDFDSREAFVLKQYQGLSYKEISEITDSSPNAVKNRVWRAKEKIKEILTPYLDDVKKFE